MTEMPVLFEVLDGVGIITLNRPACLNAVDVTLATGLGAALESAHRNTSVRAILLRGSGRAFCAGGDVAAFVDRQTYGEAADSAMSRFHPAVLSLAMSPLPSVAQLHGAVAGAGFGLMLACDFAIAAEDTKFTLAYPKIGGTIDGGASWFLPRLLGVAKAKELALLSDTFDGREAKAIGLVRDAVPAGALGQAALQLASRLARGPTAAYGAIKHLIDTAADSGLAAHLDRERAEFVRLAGSNDFDEGLRAFRQKRDPEFRGD